MTNETAVGTITMTVEIPEKLCRDIIITACEGGIGYWSLLETYNGPAIDEGREGALPLRLLDQADGENGEWMDLGVEQIVLGLQRLVAERPLHPMTTRMLRAVVNYESGDYDYDADDADGVVQYGVLGEWRYG